MGIYLNSVSPYTLYKSEVCSPYFVDKSQMLRELIPLAEVGNRHVCVTRPRRFGKTVMANMIGAFFGKDVASKNEINEIIDGIDRREGDLTRRVTIMSNVLFPAPFSPRIPIRSPS